MQERLFRVRFQITAVGFAVLLSFGMAGAQTAKRSPTPPCNVAGDLPRYEPIVRALERSGIQVSQLCRSHFENTFVPANSVALVFTEVGAFELIVFDDEAALANLEVQSTAVVDNGQTWYRTTLSGIATNPSPFEAEGKQQMYFLRYRNNLLISFDGGVDTRLRAALGAPDTLRTRAAPN